VGTSGFGKTQFFASERMPVLYRRDKIVTAVSAFMPKLLIAIALMLCDP